MLLLRPTLNLMSRDRNFQSTLSADGVPLHHVGSLFPRGHGLWAAPACSRGKGDASPMTTKAAQANYLIRALCKTWIRLRGSSNLR